ncbi:MAG: myo-inositol 2-dehydrogenase [Pelagibacterales bacterium]|nr:myo-inositol 2-dehydrogenase [Pelagibacterales bacterium]|tara:strand:- start:1092 stop:2039 length:948 start_codon:yes stop_codon:yes gene_type:complete
MKKIWLIGAGRMAQDYLKVLEVLKATTTIIGRGENSAKDFKGATGRNVETGGLHFFLSKKPDPCTHAIIAVGIEKLYETTMQLLNHNVKNILIEKPGALLNNEFKELVSLSELKKANVYIAYNRRYFASVIKAKEIIAQDGGITSFNFDFTEWAHEIESLKKEEGVKEKWFLGNSSHVVDLAFNIGGTPKELSSYTHGGVDWHPSASIFCGAGISDKGALFNYTANWESAGRWGVEVLTKEHKLILRPMEKLKIQKRGSIALNFVEEIDYSLDEKYKPGLFLQTTNFINADFSNLCSIQDQRKMITTYNKMANYK